MHGLAGHQSLCYPSRLRFRTRSAPATRHERRGARYDTRRFLQIRQEEPGRNGRPEVRRHARHAGSTAPSRSTSGTRTRSRRASASTARRFAAGWAFTNPTCSPMPDADTALHRSVFREADRQRHRQRRRSGDRQGFHPRPAARRAQGRSVPEGVRHRRHLLHRARARVLHLRRGPLRAEPAPRLLRDRFGRRRLEHRAHRGAEPRLQAELQGRLLSGEPDRHLPRSARRDGRTRCARSASSSRRTTTKSRRPARARSTCSSSRCSRWPISSCGTSTSARTSRSATARR